MKRILLIAPLLLALASYAFPAGSTPAQSEHLETTAATTPNAQRGPTHGTVNVFLANKNGLVVVTDSALSNGRAPVGFGQKLFRVDDHTICSIAGWYSDSGPAIKPDVADEPSYPARLAVPDIIQTVISSAAVSSLSVERKMEVLSHSFAFALLFVANVDQAAGVSLSVDQLNWTSEITLAGFDDKGILEILQTDLVPKIQDGKVVEYGIEAKPTVYVTETSGFVSIFRGIYTTAQSIRNGSYPSMASDPILGYFQTALASDKGSSLSLQDMEQIAKQIERRTAQQFPRSVGGSQQIAKLNAGRISEFVQPISVPFHVPMSMFSTMNRVGFHNFARFIVVNPPAVTFVQGSTFSSGAQPLDNVFFFRSDFTRVEFEYSGSPRAIFDKSNTIVDSTLTLLPGADPNSNFVRQIRADFPALTIIDQTRASRK